MFSMFLNRYTKDRPLLKLPYRRDIVQNYVNLNRIKENRELNIMFSATDHKLVQMIKMSALLDVSDRVNFIHSSSARLLNKRGTFKTAYGPSIGEPKHDFFSPKVDEYWSIIGGQGTFVHKDHWRDYKPVRIVSHPYAAVEIPILDGSLPPPTLHAITGESNAFLIINAKELFNMYYEYVLERTVKGINNPMNVEQFVSRYILPSMVEDFVNHAMLNLHYFQHEKIKPYDKVNNSPLFQVPVNLAKHTNPRSLKSYTSRSFLEWLEHFPFMGDGMISSMSAAGIPRYGRYHTFAVMSSVSHIEMIADCAPDRAIKAETAVISEFNILIRRLKGEKYVPKSFMKRLEYAQATLRKRR